MRRAISALVFSAYLGAGCGDDAASRGDAGPQHDDAGMHGDHGGPGRHPDAGPADGSVPAKAGHARVEQACDLLLECDTVPGPALEADRCHQAIAPACVECVLDRATGATSGDGAEGEDEDAGADGPCGAARGADSECAQACLSLVATPQTPAECLDIVSASTPNPPCLCEHCLIPFRACADDADCLRVADCCGRAGEFGTGCFFVPECMTLILELGPTSISTALATEVGRCITDNLCDME